MYAIFILLLHHFSYLQKSFPIYPQRISKVERNAKVISPVPLNEDAICGASSNAPPNASIAKNTSKPIVNASKNDTTFRVEF